MISMSLPYFACFVCSFILVNDYLQGISKFGHFTGEQALAMLTFHNFDIKLATEDLKKYRPVEKKWCENDRVAFENAIKLDGKKFLKLQEAVSHHFVLLLLEETEY